MILDHAAAVLRFVEHMNVLRRESGNPSLGRLAELSEGKLLKTTLDDHLSGRRVRLPTWELVAAYVVACHRAAASTGLEVQTLGALRDWHNCYKAALEGNAETPCPVKVHGGEAADSKAKEVIGDGKSPTGTHVYMPDVLYCSECHDDIPRGARFCANCGSRVSEDNIGGLNIDGDLDKPVLSPAKASRYHEIKRTIQSLPVHSAIIIVDSGYESGRQQVVMDKNIMAIGRDGASDVVIDDASVSRRHSIIIRQGGKYLIRDVDSLNGTFVNRRPIEEEVLKSGDIIHIGAVRLRFFEGGAYDV